jgi:hypothetical protein
MRAIGNSSHNILMTGLSPTSGPGYWTGLSFLPSSVDFTAYSWTESNYSLVMRTGEGDDECVLEHMTVEHAGAAGSAPGVKVSGSAPALKHLTVRHVSGDGIRFESGSQLLVQYSHVLYAVFNAIRCTISLGSYRYHAFILDNTFELSGRGVFLTGTVGTRGRGETVFLVNNDITNNLLCTSALFVKDPACEVCTVTLHPLQLYAHNYTLFTSQQHPMPPIPHTTHAHSCLKSPHIPQVTPYAMASPRRSNHWVNAFGGCTTYSH